MVGQTSRYVGKTRSVKTAFKVSEHILLTKNENTSLCGYSEVPKWCLFLTKTISSLLLLKFGQKKVLELASTIDFTLLFSSLLLLHTLGSVNPFPPLSLFAGAFSGGGHHSGCALFPCKLFKNGPHHQLELQHHVQQSRRTFVESLNSDSKASVHSPHATPPILWADAPHEGMKTLIWVLSFPLKASAQELWVAQSLVHRLESRCDYWGKGMRVIRWRNAISECSLVEAPWLTTLGALCVVVRVIAHTASCMAVRSPLLSLMALP